MEVNAVSLSLMIALIAFEQNCDMELCFAKAHVALKKWLLENEGGY